MHVEAAVALERARLLSEQASKRRKRKKRRKRRTPRTSSLPSLRRPRRRQRQLHVPGWFYWWYAAGRAVLFAVVSRPEMLGIKAVLDQKNSYALFLHYGMCKAGIAGTVHLAMCLFPWFAGPCCLASRPVWTKRTFLRSSTPAFAWSRVQLLDEVVVPVVCNDICPGPAACTVGDDFRLVSVFCVALGSTADTCGASVYKAFWKNFSHLSLKRWIAVLEVDSRLSVLPVFSAMLGSSVAGGESFSPDDAYDSAWNSVKPMKGKYTINYFQYQDVVGCVCMHNDASAASTIFAPTTTTTTSSS